MTKKSSVYRLKVTTACQNCQRRKIKCSGEIPCTYCVKLDRECQPGKPGKKRGPPPGQEIIRSRNSRLESIINDAARDPKKREALMNVEGIERHGIDLLRYRDENELQVVDSLTRLRHVSHSEGGPQTKTPIIRDLNNGQHSKVDRWYSQSNVRNGQAQSTDRLELVDNVSPFLRKPKPIYPVHMKERQIAHIESINRNSNESITYRNSLPTDSPASSSSGLVSSLSYPTSPSLASSSSLVLSPKHSPTLSMLPPLSKSITASPKHSSLPTLPPLSSSISSSTNSSFGQSQFWRKPSISHSYLTSNNSSICPHSTFLNDQTHSHSYHTTWNYSYPKPLNNHISDSICLDKNPIHQGSSNLNKGPNIPDLLNLNKGHYISGSSSFSNKEAIPSNRIDSNSTLTNSEHGPTFYFLPPLQFPQRYHLPPQPNPLPPLQPVSDSPYIPSPPPPPLPSQDNHRKSLEWTQQISSITRNFNDARVVPKINNEITNLSSPNNHDMTNDVCGITTFNYSDSEKEKNKSVTSESKSISQGNKLIPRFVPIKAYPTDKKPSGYGTRGRSTSSAKTRHSTDGSGAVTYQALNRRSTHTNRNTNGRGVHQTSCQQVKTINGMVDQQNSFNYSYNYDVSDSKYEINKSFTSSVFGVESQFKGNCQNDVMQRGHFTERIGDETNNVISKIGSIDDSRLIDSSIINKGKASDSINKFVDTISLNAVDSLILADTRRGENKSVTLDETERRTFKEFLDNSLVSSTSKIDCNKYQENEQSSRPITPPRCDTENLSTQKNRIGSLQTSDTESVLTPPTIQDDLSAMEFDDCSTSNSSVSITKSTKNNLKKKFQQGKVTHTESKSKLKKDKMGVVTLTDSEDSYNSERNKRNKREDLIKNVTECDTDDTYDDDDDDEYRPKRPRPINNRKRASAVPRRITRRTKPPAPKDPSKKWVRRKE
ncbi:gpi mannosyltransferase 2 [Gigaspora margarita]|uniref:Gpi mannosyltransferase 2 n=1 Tax=Gigaspora margarita TaxID=4874 RepID=A0A8H4EKD2_GIGMA|nr:gpi mannosyltransferase 2 [Gigaspora margarita]